MPDFVDCVIELRDDRRNLSRAHFRLLRQKRPVGVLILNSLEQCDDLLARICDHIYLSLDIFNHLLQSGWFI